MIQKSRIGQDSAGRAFAKSPAAEDVLNCAEYQNVSLETLTEKVRSSCDSKPRPFKPQTSTGCFESLSVLCLQTK